ncbi:MAG: hypothetical protein AAB257_09705, partial [Nitrospinota bacterium]
IKELKYLAGDVEGIRIYRGECCKECASTGYWGRIAVYEVLLIDDSIRGLILKNPEANIIKSAGIKNGMKTLKEEGLRMVMEGITSMDELLRVIQGD